MGATWEPNRDSTFHCLTIRLGRGQPFETRGRRDEPAAASPSRQSGGCVSVSLSYSTTLCCITVLPVRYCTTHKNNKLSRLFVGLPSMAWTAAFAPRLPSANIAASGGVRQT